MRTSNIIPTRNFANPSHAIIVAGAIMQEVIPHVGNLSSNWVLLKWDLSLIKQIYGLIHKFSRLINFFSTTACLSSSCVYKILVHIFCFDPNYRTVGVASIQMLLAQPILDMAYFRHYYYYGHLLSIFKIYNPEETCCYARPVSVVINSNTGLKCWPCRGRIPSCPYQAFFTEYVDTTTFAWILDV